MKIDFLLNGAKKHRGWRTNLLVLPIGRSPEGGVTLLPSHAWYRPGAARLLVVFLLNPAELRAIILTSLTQNGQ